MTLAGAEFDGRHSYVPEWVTPALGDEIEDDSDEWATPALGSDDCMIYISVYKGTNLKIYGPRVTRH